MQHNCAMLYLDFICSADTAFLCYCAISGVCERVSKVCYQSVSFLVTLWYHSSTLPEQWVRSPRDWAGRGRHGGHGRHHCTGDRPEKYIWHIYWPLSRSSGAQAKLCHESPVELNRFYEIILCYYVPLR